MQELYLTPKQAEYIREAHHRWNFAIGAVRSGKSRIALQYIIPQGLVERRGLKGLNFILGASYGNIVRNVIEPMAEIWGGSLVKYKKSSGTAEIFGEQVYLLGADNIRAANRLRGSEIKFCYCDEVCDINEETFDMLASRLSLEYSICHAAANPTYPEHFIKRFLDRAGDVDIYCQHYTLYDNPFLPESYVRGLEAEYAGTVYFQRYILGQWTKAEGLIWPMYEEALGTPKEGSTPTDIGISIDYGTQNPFAVWLWEKHEDVWYATRDYYYNGRAEGRQKTDADYAEDLEAFLKEEIKAVGNDVTSPRIKAVIDPSAASFIALLKKKTWCKVLKADNRVADGLRDTATAMQRGKIKIAASKEWISEAAGYVWDDKKEDTPVKENDHLCDALRYWVRTMKVVKPKNEFQPMFML